LEKNYTGARIYWGINTLARYYIGTSGWHYDDWRGRFYPEKLPKAKWLEFYARHFPTVELNNTFYRLPSEAAFTNWYDSSPPGFTYAVKVSRFITHIKRLKDCNEAVTNFMSRAGILKEKLGPLLYQLPPSMHRNDDRLALFLSGLSPEFRHVIEFRHESWLTEDVFDILRKYHAGICVFDMPESTCPLLATADFAYIRFHGSDSLYSSCYSDEELSDWAKRIIDLAKNLDSVYIYFNNDVQGFALRNAEAIRLFLA
jgi:uncharacterized protein YecE (DUF72 family)